jgi:hypothetical protein
MVRTNVREASIYIEWVSQVARKLASDSALLAKKDSGSWLSSGTTKQKV